MHTIKKRKRINYLKREISIALKRVYEGLNFSVVFVINDENGYSLDFRQSNFRHIF